MVLRSPRTSIVNKTIQFNVGDSREWQYTVFWKTLPSLESSPSHLSFGNLLDGMGDHSKSTIISSTMNEKFGIISVACDPRDILIEAIVDDANEATHHAIQLKAPKRSGAIAGSADGPRKFLSGAVHVHTTDKLRPVVEIPWTAMLDPTVKTRSQSKQPGKSSEAGL